MVTGRDILSHRPTGIRARQKHALSEAGEWELQRVSAL